MAANIDIAEMWALNDNRQPVKLSLPPLPLHSLPEPLRLSVDFEAGMVEEMLDGWLCCFTPRAYVGPREDSLRSS